MSNFILNLVHRGAGLTPSVVHPSLPPVLPPDRSAENALQPGLEARAVEDASEEMPMPSAPAPSPPAVPGSRHASVQSSLQSSATDTPGVQLQASRASEAVLLQPRVEPAMPPPVVPTPAVSPVGSPPAEGSLSTPTRSEPETAPVASATAAAPMLTHNRAATPSPVAQAGALSVRSDGGIARGTPASEDRATSAFPFPGPPQATQPSRRFPEEFSGHRTVATVTPAVTDATPHAAGAPRPETGAQVPSIAPRATLPQAIVRPAQGTEAAPPFSTLTERTATPVEPPAIHVRIGTIEVRATTPPAPPPAPVVAPRGLTTRWCAATGTGDTTEGTHGRL